MMQIHARRVHRRLACAALLAAAAAGAQERGRLVVFIVRDDWVRMVVGVRSLGFKVLPWRPSRLGYVRRGEHVMVARQFVPPREG